MMTLLSFLGLFNIICNILSSAILVIIYKYVNSKPPGLQTVLDLLILDCIRLGITRNILQTIMINLGVFNGQLNILLAKILFGVTVNFSALLIAFAQVTVVVKAILVFKAHWLTEVPDGQVIRISRIIAGIYASLRFFIDFWLVEPGPTLLLRLATGVLTNT